MYTLFLERQTKYYRFCLNAIVWSKRELQHDVSDARTVVSEKLLKLKLQLFTLHVVQDKFFCPLSLLILCYGGVVAACRREILKPLNVVRQG